MSIILLKKPCEYDIIIYGGTLSQVITCRRVLIARELAAQRIAELDHFIERFEIEPFGIY